jgi:hypothetical protein
VKNEMISIHLKYHHYILHLIEKTIFIYNLINVMNLYKSLTNSITSFFNINFYNLIKSNIAIR